MDFSAEMLIKYYNEILDEVVNFIIKANKMEDNPIEALAITNKDSCYKASYMTFGWEDRNPDECNESIWHWWKGEKIVAKNQVL